MVESLNIMIMDQKFKMPRDHKREVEKLQKQYRQDAREVGMDVCVCAFYQVGTMLEENVSGKL